MQKEDRPFKSHHSISRYLQVEHRKLVGFAEDTFVKMVKAVGIEQIPVEGGGGHKMNIPIAFPIKVFPAQKQTKR